MPILAVVLFWDNPRILDTKPSPFRCAQSYLILKQKKHEKSQKCDVMHFLCRNRGSIWDIIIQKSNSETPIIRHYIKEIEKWILRLLSAPVPVPGKTRVEVFFFSLVQFLIS